MEVIEFRFFTTNDSYDDTPNWSRRYEWCYALQVLQKQPKLYSIHNTCCGPGMIHQIFHDRVAALGREVVNSDSVKTPINSAFQNFEVYDLLTPNARKFDCVLCISTLEELKDEAAIVCAYHNLLAQVRPGGRLVITCDVPGVRVGLLEELVGETCEDGGVRLNGANSAWPDARFAHLNVLLLDLSV